MDILVDALIVDVAKILSCVASSSESCSTLGNIKPADMAIVVSTNLEFLTNLAKLTFFSTIMATKLPSNS